MELVLKDAQSTLTVSETTFGRDFNEVLVHQVVVAYVASARQSTRAQKTRAEVTGSGKKLWRRRGTDRTRSGSIRSPIWHSGSMTFVTRPRGHSQKVNRKIYRDTLKSILSELIRQDRLIAVGKFPIEAPKTKLLIQELKDMALEGVLIITGELDENLFPAAHNLHRVDVYDATGADPVSLIAFNKVVMTADAIKQIKEILA